MLLILKVKNFYLSELSFITNIKHFMKFINNLSFQFLLYSYYFHHLFFILLNFFLTSVKTDLFLN